MALLFIDETDTEGRIGDDFTVEYDGPENVQVYINELIREAVSYDGAIEDIILDMVHDLRIHEVRREE